MKLHSRIIRGFVSMSYKEIISFKKKKKIKVVFFKLINLQWNDGQNWSEKGTPKTPLEFSMIHTLLIIAIIYRLLRIATSNTQGATAEMEV